MAERFSGTYYTYGFSDADFQASGCQLNQAGSFFTVSWQGKKLTEATIKLPGRHNILNSLSVFAVCYLLNISPEVITTGLSSFPGVRRRLEVRGSYRGVVVIDDYGHHPSEIRTALSAVRQLYPAGRLFVVFQPHQYSRTRFFLSDFAASFSLADEVIVPEIYFVRDSEESRRSVCAADLVAKIQNQGKEARFIPTFDGVAAYLKEKVKSGDIVLTIGAGPVYRVADLLCEGLTK